MRTAVKFLTLERQQKFLLLRCIFVVAAARLALLMVPFKLLHRWVRTDVTSEASAVEERQVAWGVHHASRVIPGATCLTQALAGQFLLSRLGRHAQIRVGVKQGADGRLLAHAWLMSGGRIVLGGSDEELRRYTRLVDFDAGPA